MSYLKTAAEAGRNTHQRSPIPGRDMVANSEGGYVFAAGDFERLRRFLILGSEGGSYYASERELTAENAGAVARCLRADGSRTVREIAEVSKGGRAPRNDEAIFALAMACTPQYADEDTRRAAFAAVTDVCRTGTHIFQFCGFVDSMRGWGSGLRRAVAAWYESRSADDLAYQVIKYRQRDGWTHRDVLRLSHPADGSRRYPAPDGTESYRTELPKGKVYDWICGRAEANHAERYSFKDGDIRREIGVLPDAVVAYEQAQRASSPAEVVSLIGRHGSRLPREAIPTQFLKDPAVWSALLGAGMPMTALVRNLANMTRYGVLTPGSEGTRLVVSQLADVGAISGSRIHPVNMLRALYVYRAGRSPRSRFGSPDGWNPVPEIIDALDEAFYLAFGNVEGHGKRRLIAVDTSASMTWPESAIGGVPGFYALHGAAAMSLVSLHAGDPTTVVAFSAGGGYRSGYRTDGLRTVPVSRRQRLDDAVSLFGGGGGTDCSLPMKWAEAEGLEFDVFEVYTDNETWAGTPHPSQALANYRRASGIQSRCAVVGMVSNGFTIADPQDPGMLDVVGFDSAAPQIISDFGAGLI